MKDPNWPNRPRSRVKTGSKHTWAIIFMLALVIILTSSFFLFKRYKHADITQILYSIQKLFPNDHIPGVTKISEEESKAPQPNQTGASRSPDQDHSSVPDADISTESSSTLQKNDVLNQKDPLSSETSAAMSLSEQQLGDDLNAFYAHLDQQTYMRDFHLKEPSKIHFSKLLHILINKPPMITRETDDYFTLLKNTAHFYRILGKENIFVLKGILDREKDSFEHILKIFYALTDHPEYLKNEFSLVIPKDNLYDYAGFFLNTIGGRLYLFRRDSVSRMTISYYAVLIVDKANREGNSRLGIDLRPAINSLIEEIENTGNNLKLKEEYLDTLFDLKEYYENRG